MLDFKKKLIAVPPVQILTTSFFPPLSEVQYQLIISFFFFSELISMRMILLHLLLPPTVPLSHVAICEGGGGVREETSNGELGVFVTPAITSAMFGLPHKGAEADV